MTVRDIIRNFLKRSNYDGLFNQAGECACLVDKLFPCDDYDIDCQPGYIGWCEGDGQCGWCDKGDARHWHIQDRPATVVATDEDSP